MPRTARARVRVCGCELLRRRTHPGAVASRTRHAAQSCVVKEETSHRGDVRSAQAGVCASTSRRDLWQASMKQPWQRVGHGTCPLAAGGWIYARLRIDRAHGERTRSQNCGSRWMMDGAVRQSATETFDVLMRAVTREAPSKSVTCLHAQKWMDDDTCLR